MFLSIYVNLIVLQDPSSTGPEFIRKKQTQFGLFDVVVTIKNDYQYESLHIYMGKPNTNYYLIFLSQQIRKFLRNCHALTLIITQTHMIF